MSLVTGARRYRAVMVDDAGCRKTEVTQTHGSTDLVNVIAATVTMATVSLRSAKRFWAVLLFLQPMLTHVQQSLLALRIGPSITICG